MILFVDTETTGTNPQRDRLVQLAWIIATAEGCITSRSSMIVRPEGFDIPQGAARIHGITTETAMRSGMLLKRCLQQLLTAGQEATLLVAHNLSYDIGILKEEFHRAALPNAFASVSGICTMRAATNYCRLPKTSNRGGYKYPKLDELHRHLFGYDFINAHNAEADTEACMRCFFELCKLGIIDLSKLAPSVACPPQSKACVPSNAPRNSMNSGNIDSPPQDDYLRSHETAIDRKSNHHARGNRDQNIVGGSDLRNPYQRAVLRFGGQSEQGLRLGSGFSYPTQFEFPVASTSGRGNDQATTLPTTDKALSPPAKQMDAVSSWQSDRRRRQEGFEQQMERGADRDET